MRCKQCEKVVRYPSRFSKLIQMCGLCRREINAQIQKRMAQGCIFCNDPVDFGTSCVCGVGTLGDIFDRNS